MNRIIELLNVLGDRVFEFAGPMFWQSSLLITLVFAFDLAFRKKIRAAVRYALWMVVLLKLIVPPSLALPTGVAWWVPSPSATFNSIPPSTQSGEDLLVLLVDPPAPAIPPSLAFPNPEPLLTFPDPEPSLTPSVAASAPALVAGPALLPSAWALIVSALISGGLFGWMLVRWRHVVLLVRNAEPAGEHLQHALSSATCALGLRHTFDLRVTPCLISPAVCGLFRPAILLPQSLVSGPGALSDQHLRAVLLHELLHVRRRDVLVNCAQAMLQALYWWHPLVWLANARIRRVREEAVDDCVMLAMRDDADAYAPALLAVARLALRRPAASLGLIGIMESRSALRQRLERLIHFSTPGNAGVSAASLAALALFTMAAVPMGQAPATESAQSAQAQSGTSAPTSPAPITPSAAETPVVRRTVEVTNEWESPRLVATAPTITNASRRAIAAKLDSIRLPRVAFNQMPLQEVVQMLSAESRRLDPEGKGINFLISATREESSGRELRTVDPTTGQLLPGARVPANEVVDPATGMSIPKVRPQQNQALQNILVTINPPLLDISLRDALDAVITVAERPVAWSVREYGVMFGPRLSDVPQLQTRLFKVDPTTLHEFLEGSGELVSESRTEPNRAPRLSAAVAKHFASLGVDLNPAAGRSIFVNDRNGTMLVRATAAELDVINTSVESINYRPPQVHIQVRLYELSEKDEHELRTQLAIESPGTNLWTGILSDPQFRVTLRAVDRSDDATLISQQQVTTLSGRNAQVHSTELLTVIKGINPLALQPPGLASSETNSLYRTDVLPFGTVVDLTPVVEADGMTIRLHVAPSVTEFLGYDNQGETNRVLVYINGAREWVPLPLPGWTSRMTSTSAAVEDGQTLVLGALPGNDFQRYGKPGDKRLIAFITATIIDPAGNRVNAPRR